MIEFEHSWLSIKKQMDTCRMNEVIILTIPYPPTVNTYKKIGRLTKTKSGKLYQVRANTDITKRFYFEVWLKVKQLQLESLGDAVLRLEMYVYPPDKRKRDLDNVIKPGVDSLMKAGLFNDDSQIACLYVQKMGIISQGKVEIKIFPIVGA
jgi:crossover junction endodeoxyribonuclease RusA